MAQQTKKTLIGIVKETVEGVPLKITAGTEFIPIQEGFEVSFANEQLTNAELTGSIGASADSPGIETPESSFDLYLKHSGIPGQQPNIGPIFEAVMGNDADVEAVEYDTVAGSTAGDSTTAAVINVDAGEGSFWIPGQPALIKDLVNGYSIRPVESIAGDALTLAFNLDNAPAASVNLGKAITYVPGELHPSLSLWDYRGNGSAVQLASGNRVTEHSINISAGEFINTSSSLAGIEYFYNPIVIEAGVNDAIDFTDSSGAVSAVLAPGTYKDAADAGLALAAAMTGASVASAGDTITVVYGDTDGKFTVATDGTTLDIDFLSTANTLGLEFGFSTDVSASTSYISDSAYNLTAPFSPSFDSTSPLVAKNNECFIGSFDDNVCFPIVTADITITNGKANERDICASSGIRASAITSREVEIELVAQIPVYDIDKFTRFRTNQTTRFLYNGGVKSGGNWVDGKCFSIYGRTMKITAFNLGDEEDLVTLNMTLKCFVDSGNPEFFLGFV